MSLKQRHFIFLSYDGSCYHGWQVQPGKCTVQSKLVEALTTILRERIKTTGAERTDTGVHARKFVAHFDTAKKDLRSNQKILFRINRFMPVDIAINDILTVDNQAHARFDAKSRTYKYYISLKKNPFIRKYSWYRYRKQ